MEEVRLRNVFRVEDNPEELQRALEPFPNKVPRFTKKTDCIEFMREHSGISSNPEFPELRHSVTTLVNWKQIEKFLLPKLIQFNQMSAPKVYSPDIGLNNRFMHSATWTPPHTHSAADDDSKGEGDLSSSGATMSTRELRGCELIRQYLSSRLSLPVHQRLSHYSTMHTLKYLFYHMKCGILVSIRNNQLAVFCPFVNRDYENNWHDILDIDGTIEAYYLSKSRHYRDEAIIEKSRWWANGNIICNEEDQQLWGDHFLLPLRDMLSETCNNREVPDCDFFLNKRDYPHLKFNSIGKKAVEPYGFIYDCDDRDPTVDVDLTRHNYPTYAPILSFYTSDRFADIPFPPSEDWEAATGEVFPPSMNWQPKKATGTEGSTATEEVPKVRDLFTSDNLKKFDKQWIEKKDVAFFRGTATGGGVTADTNQRLKVAVLSEEWKDDPRYTGYLDAKIVGWNFRDKKMSGKQMTYIRKSNFPFTVTAANFTPIYEQSSYKYLLYIEGHCAACRYGFMMVLGSVILKVESRCVADQLWYFPLLEPYYDHVPVKADLSDLAEQIEWCRTHDEECKQIAKRAREIHDRFLSKEGILDYMQMTLCEISRKWVRPLDCFRDSSTNKPIPYDAASDNRNHCLEIKGDPTLCISCESIHAIQEKKIQEQLNAGKVAGNGKVSRKGSLLRRKRKAEDEDH